MDRRISRKGSWMGKERLRGAASGVLVVLCLGLCRSSGANCTPFVRGDVDLTGTLSITDAVRILQYLFLETGESSRISCDDAADVDDSGAIDVSFAIEMAKRSSARKKQLFCVASGRGLCGDLEEAEYLRETLDAITVFNGGEVEIDTLSILPVEKSQEDFLREMAERNGGTYTNVKY